MLSAARRTFARARPTTMATLTIARARPTTLATLLTRATFATALSFRTPRSSYDAQRDALRSPEQRDAYWLAAAEGIEWFKAPTSAVDLSDAPFAKWFPDGTTNLCYNALDRHVQAGHGDRTAVAYISTVGGASRDVSYAELLADVASLAGSLEALGVEAGDRVLLWCPRRKAAVLDGRRGDT